MRFGFRHLEKDEGGRKDVEERHLGIQEVKEQNQTASKETAKNKQEKKKKRKMVGSGFRKEWLSCNHLITFDNHLKAALFRTIKLCWNKYWHYAIIYGILVKKVTKHECIKFFFDITKKRQYQQNSTTDNRNLTVGK